MENKEWFLPIHREYIHREDSKKFLNYLLSEHGDFSHAPASTHFYGTYTQGLPEHSLSVYDCLKNYLSRPRVKECHRMGYNEETIAIVVLPHDICKINCYKEGTRNQKVNGRWVQVPFYECEGQLPYGYGEKSVYITTGFMRLSREEVFAIRYHMGFSGSKEIRSVGAAFEIYPLASALSAADMEAIYYLEGK